ESCGRVSRPAMAVDARLRPPRRPHANPRLRGDARGCDGSIRQELATGIGPPARHWGAVHRRSRAGRPEWLTKWQGSKRSVWLGRYSIMKPKLMWSRPPRITGLPETGAKLVMGARRKGRPPLGSQATSGAERARRYRQRLAQLGKHASER